MLSNRTRIGSYFARDPKRQALQQMLAMLASRYDALDDSRKAYLAALDSPVLQAAKFFTAAVTATFFFGGGFFAGQTLALAVAGLFVATASATFLPVVVASAVVGLAALSLYWFVQRPALDNIVGEWMGLDKERIDILADRALVSQNRLELNKLANKVARFDRLTSQVEQLTRFEKTITPSFVRQESKPASIESITHHHTFFSPLHPRSPGDLNDPETLGLAVA